MRALLCAACLLGGCTASLGGSTALNLGFDGQVRHRANAVRPRWSVGLRLSVIRQPGGHP